MLSHSARIACASNKCSLKSLSLIRSVRLASSQTSTEAPAETTLEHKAEGTLEKTNSQTSTPRQYNRESRPNVIPQIRNAIGKDYTEFSVLFENIQHTMKNVNPSFAGRLMAPMVSTAHAIFNKIDEIKKTTQNEIPSSILYKEIITLLFDHQLIHASHFNRYIMNLLNDGKYLNALTIWIENANYFKEKPEVFKTSKQRENLFEEYKLAGLTSYLLSLIVNKEDKVDPEFIKLIFGDSKPATMGQFTRYLGSLSLPAEDRSTIEKFYENYKNESFDINSAEALKGIRVAAIDGRIVHLENSVNKNLELYKGKESEIKPSTISHYMEYLNRAKLYSRSIELWKFAVTHKIEITIDIWNQLLKSFISVSMKDNKTKIESVWKLLNQSVTPNSESYSIYLKYLLKNREVSKAESIIADLKKNHPKLFDSELKCALIEFLVVQNKSNEAYQLFRLYQNGDKGFVPTIEVYNKLLSKLINDSRFTEAENLLADLLSKKYENLSPDVATWTTIIDFYLKTSLKSNLSREEILDKITSVIKTMISQHVGLNSVALTTVVTNLLKNNETMDLGFELLHLFESSNLKLNQVGYTGIITAFSNKGDMNNALYYYNKALEHGILPSAFLYNSILKGYSKSPNIPETKKFMQNIESLIKANPQTTRLLPNYYTYYFLLSQAISANDSQFIGEILTKLGESNIELGKAIPIILKSLHEKGYQLPKSLLSKIE